MNERWLLEEAAQVFSRKIRHCDVIHESVKKDDANNPLPILIGNRESLNYKQECTNKHFACPHYLRIMVERHIIMILDNDTSKLLLDPKIEEEFASLTKFIDAQNTLDAQIRKVRIGDAMDGDKYLTLQSQIAHLPSQESIDEKLPPLLKQFNENCDKIDGLRLSILEKLQKALDKMPETEKFLLPTNV